MRRYTTPTIQLTIAGIDLTGTDVYVTFSQGERTLTITDPALVYDSSNGGLTTIYVPLTQAQTAKFNVSSPVNVQVNWIDSNEMRNATDVKQIPVLINTLQEIIEYED